MTQIVIKKGTINATLDRNELVELVETPNGINFNFKHGLTLICDDMNMPLHTKNIMKNTSDNFPNKKLIFNLENYNKPVLVDAT